MFDASLLKTGEFSANSLFLYKFFIDKIKSTDIHYMWSEFKTHIKQHNVSEDALLFFFCELQFITVLILIHESYMS